MAYQSQHRARKTEFDSAIVKSHLADGGKKGKKQKQMIGVPAIQEKFTRSSTAKAVRLCVDEIYRALPGQRAHDKGTTELRKRIDDRDREHRQQYFAGPCRRAPPSCFKPLTCPFFS